MAQIINKIDAVSSLFAGQGDIIVFAAITEANYATADLASLITPQTLGDIFEGSTNWTGDDIAFEEISNEQGIAVGSKTVVGSFSYEFTHMSVTDARIKMFMAGTTIANPSALPTWLGAAPTPVITGFGHEVGVITRPIAVLNETKDKWLIFPKAKIATSLVSEGTNFMMKSIVSAESISTDDLKTVILLTGLAVYATS